MKTQGILTFLNVPGIGTRTVSSIIQRIEKAMSLDKADILDLLTEESKTNSRITVPSKEKLAQIYSETERQIEENLKAGIGIIDQFDPQFPDKLKTIPNSPLILYVRGNVSALNSKDSVAVIGTRQPTDFGKRAGERMSGIFAQEGFTIVSGLAIGCDTAGHVGCLSVDGTTIAVLAGGLDKIYPKDNTKLADEILEKNGCLISEYSKGVSPRANYFVERDRLQSGLSNGVIVLETDIKGGTMHTVKFSQLQHRLLACLWGHPDNLINHPKLQGNKMLIDTGKASKLSTQEEIDLFIHELRNERKNLSADVNINDNGPGITIVSSGQIKIEF